MLDNSDDRFNPLNTSSPYYDSTNNRTKISPFKQIKIKAEYDGSTSVLFSGFIQSYPESFGGQGADSSVRIRCVDAFKIFNLNTIGARGWKIGSTGFSELGETTRLGYVRHTRTFICKNIKIIRCVWMVFIIKRYLNWRSTSQSWTYHQQLIF